MQRPGATNLNRLSYLVIGLTIGLELAGYVVLSLVDDAVADRDIARAELDLERAVAYRGEEAATDASA